MIFLVTVPDFLLKKLLHLLVQLLLFFLLSHQIQVTIIIQININMQQKAYFESLVADWTHPVSRDLLKQRIRSHSPNKQMETSDNILSQQYFRSWLDIPMSNPLQRLVRHPLLTKQDKLKIDGYVSEQQQSQIKYAGLFVSITMGFYLVFLRKNSFFQNFFNNRERRRAFNISRKVFGVWLVFVSWMQVLASHYQKRIPQGLNQMGMFKKYRILFQEKYV